VLVIISYGNVIVRCFNTNEIYVTNYYFMSLCIRQVYLYFRPMKPAQKDLSH